MTTRGIGRWVERHRRGLVVCYLTAVGLVCAVVVVPGLRAAVAGGVSRIFEMREAALRERITQAEVLLDSGEFEAATTILYDLDARFPARIARHALDRDRERIFHALGAAEQGLGRKTRSLVAYRAAVSFDPRNIGNHYALASAALALDEPAEAEQHFLDALRLFPNHAGSVRSLIEIRSEAGDYAGVIEIFEMYTAATRVHVFQLGTGDGGVWTRIPVDGHVREVRVALTTLDLTTPVEIRSPYPTFEVNQVAWEAPFSAGSTERRTGVVAPLAGSDGVRVQLPADAAVALLSARAAIPIDQATWSFVEAAYRNLLRLDEAREVLSRLQLISPESWDAAELEA